MSVFTSFFELLIKQTCRRASYEFEMGSKQSKSSEDSSGIYSLEFLKSLYDKPRDNIHKLLQVYSLTEQSQKDFENTYYIYDYFCRSPRTI